MAFCEQCGGKIEGMEKFCPSCGEKLTGGQGTRGADITPRPYSSPSKDNLAEAIRYGNYLSYAIGALGLIALLQRDTTSIVLCGAMVAAVQFMAVAELRSGKIDKAETVLKICAGLLVLFAALVLLSGIWLIGILDLGAAYLGYMAYQALGRAKEL